METSGPPFDYPCLSPTDYAAFPLYMQRLAEQVEAENIEMRARSEEAYRRPVAVWKRGTVGPIGATGVASFTFDSSTLLFSNFTQPNGSLPELSPFAVIAPRAGVWRVGWQAMGFIVGGVTPDFWYRVDMAVGRQDADGQLLAVVADSSRYMIETQSTPTGLSTFWNSEALFVVENDFDRYSCNFVFRHNNTGFSARLTNVTAWIHYIGETDSIEVT